MIIPTSITCRGGATGSAADDGVDATARQAAQSDSVATTTFTWIVSALAANVLAESCFG